MKYMGQVYTCVRENTLRVQKRIFNFLELGFQGALSYPTWVLRTELRFPAKAAPAANG